MQLQSPGIAIAWNSMFAIAWNSMFAIAWNPIAIAWNSIAIAWIKSSDHKSPKINSSVSGPKDWVYDLAGL